MTIPTPPWLYHGIAFLRDHACYWLLAVGLFFQLRYLFHRDRLQHIALVGWGEASRREKPLLYGFFIALHLVLTAVFILMLIGYLEHFT